MPPVFSKDPFPMNDEPINPPSPVVPIKLQYADAPSRHGIILEATADGVRITIPEIGFTRLLLTIAFVAMTGAFIVSSAFIAQPIIRIVMLSSEMLPVTVGLLLQIVWGIKIALVHAAKPKVIEVTASDLILTNILVEDENNVITRPRSQIYDVKYIGHSGNLVIRCHTANMIECRPVTNPIVLQWLAGVLREALQLR